MLAVAMFRSREDAFGVPHTFLMADPDRAVHKAITPVAV
jgi:hypothetical protein